MTVDGVDSRTASIAEKYDTEALSGVVGVLRRWHLVRHEDESGVSGTGIVASGVLFHDGSVAYKWRTEPSTLQYADDIDRVIEIHGHDGRTDVVWEDEPR